MTKQQEDKLVNDLKEKDDEAKKQEELQEQINPNKKWAKKRKNADIRGFIYLKAEWKGEGSQMPPIKNEKTLINNYIKDKKKMTMHQLDKYIHH